MFRSSGAGKDNSGALRSRELMHSRKLLEIRSGASLAILNTSTFRKLGVAHQDAHEPGFLCIKPPQNFIATYIMI